MRKAAILGASALLLALSACGINRVGGAPTLYDLGADERPAPSAPSRVPVALAFTSAPALADAGMIWRVGDSASPKAYAQARWASAPADLVRQRLLERLSRQGPVVSDGSAPGLPRLQVTLMRFEQVFAPDGASSAGHLALQAVLLADGRVLAQKRVQRAAPAPTQDADGGARALRQATDEAADELAAWLAGALR